ncbi:hypothetical protein [Brevibacillus borstelensis]|uniref:hypothetical protein n=1 Tax=Brevibacillus borstelensis TaxID=45462 RepID=UPI001D0B4C3B|nr:hypothetical protein [Brevibacillus borstelensis]MCC0563795.1 hypothetical protein [Brevibacillus borstelensis]
MPPLNPMPSVVLSTTELSRWGSIWLGTTGWETGKPLKNPNKFDKKQAMDFGAGFIDPAIADPLSVMLGGIPIINVPAVSPRNPGPLNPPAPDCVELGPTRVIGGIRPQYFDLVYRPDGLRIAYDSKTLNDTNSVNKNWQNMINDLATEASTVHTRFPYALVVFVVFVPRLALAPTQERDMINTLERICGRRSFQEANHLAEAISFVVWDPNTGHIDPAVPDPASPLRLERLNEIIYSVYLERYKGLPPHS